MRHVCVAVSLLLVISPAFFAQRPQQNLIPEERKALIEKRENIEKQLEDIAIIDRKVMVPMGGSGKRMAADIYRRCRIRLKKYPIIFQLRTVQHNF